MVKKFIKLFIPPILLLFYHYIRRNLSVKEDINVKEISFSKKISPPSYVNSNLLRNKHLNKRVFIAGTGQSIKNQNLLPLQNELVIGLNEFFLHHQIEQIRPAYSIFSGYCSHMEYMPKQKAIDWYTGFEKAMKKIKSNIILPIGDHDFLKENNLLQGNDMNVTYANMWIDPKEISKFRFDLPNDSYTGQNVAVMAICMAIFMGFKEIYLLGLDHDWIVGYLKKRQDHFYDDKDSIVYKEQSQEFNFSFLRDYLYTHVNLFEQYEAINKFAKENGVQIVNLTPGGFLDTFERQDLMSVLSEQPLLH